MDYRQIRERHSYHIAKILSYIKFEGTVVFDLIINMMRKSGLMTFAPHKELAFLRAIQSNTSPREGIRNFSNNPRQQESGESTVYIKR